jgi:hypothetical protein
LGEELGRARSLPAYAWASAACASLRPDEPAVEDVCVSAAFVALVLLLLPHALSATAPTAARASHGFRLLVISLLHPEVELPEERSC